VATSDDRSSRSSGFSDDGFYSSSGTGGDGGGVHHFDDASDSFRPQSYDPDTKSFDNSGYTPATTLDEPREPFEDDDDERAPFRWTAGPDLGLLVLRLVLGGTFLAHGAMKVFGLFGGPGIDGFARYLDGLGFRESRILAWVTGVTELAGGGLLVLGLFSPLAAAGLLAVMANVLALRWREGFFAPDGVELEVMLATMAFALLFAGPGRAALDLNRAWFRHPLLSGFVCLVLAGGSAAATYFVFR
jgi:putative oxidoreductase